MFKKIKKYLKSKTAVANLLLLALVIISFVASYIIFELSENAFGDSANTASVQEIIR
jgi:regulatory protein YycH of two-component signal transduction system YycFG